MKLAQLTGLLKTSLGKPEACEQRKASGAGRWRGYLRQSKRGNRTTWGNFMVRASRDTERMCNGLTVLKTCLCAIVVVTPLGACAGVPAFQVAGHGPLPNAQAPGRAERGLHIYVFLFCNVRRKLSPVCRGEGGGKRATRKNSQTSKMVAGFAPV